jgi:hypothetical protein
MRPRRALRHRRLYPNAAFALVDEVEDVGDRLELFAPKYRSILPLDDLHRDGEGLITLGDFQSCRRIHSSVALSAS